MQHLENDMDELFQRAAENYPLNEGKGDWESVAKRIADNPESPATLATVKNNSVKKITALLLLLFICAVGWFIFRSYQQGVDSVPNRNALANNIKKAEIKISSTEKDNSSSTDKHASVVADKKYKSNHYNSVGLAGKNNIESKKKNVTMSVISINKNSNPGIEKTLTGKISNNESSPESNSSFPHEENINQKKVGNNPVENKISGEDILPNNNGKEDEVNAASIAAVHDKKSKDKANKKFQKKKGIYVGVLAGPDFSKVHSGSFDRSGVNAGIMAGYRFSNRVSIESGISWDKKYYTSEGRSFRMDQVGSTMPSGMVINNLESSNSFIEIPLKLKFDFFTKRNSNLFVSGGVSAYIITREQNMYHVTYNGDNKNLLSVYEKNNYGLPAVVNLSAGYEKNIFKNFDIRIEPYLKIPLRGMGVGSLPVTSAGLQIGIIGRLK